MLTRISFCALIPLFVAGAFACQEASSGVTTAGQGPAASADHDANVELVRTWTQRFLARDFDELATLYAEDAVMMPPGEPSLQGRSKIRSWFDGAPSVASYDPAIDAVELRGDMAVVRGTYSMTFRGARGDTVQDEGKWLEVRKKQPDGSWKIAVDIFNSSRPAK